MAVFCGGCLSLKLYFMGNIYIFQCFCYQMRVLLFLLYLLCQQIVGVMAFSFKKQNSTANQCDYNGGWGLRGYSGMSWNPWAGGTAGLVQDWKAVRHYSISVFSSLLFLLCIFFLVFSLYRGISLFFYAFCSQLQPHNARVYLSPLQNTETELSFLNPSSELPEERSVVWQVVTGQGHGL